MTRVILNEFPDNGYQAVTEEQRHFAISAVTHLEEMVNNPEYFKQLASTKLKNIKLLIDPVNWKYQEATNDDFHRIIRAGIEVRRPEDMHVPDDNDINIYAALEKRDEGSLGGVTPGKRTIVTNIEKFNEWLEDDNWILLAGHWFHEWLHTSGLYHLNPDVADFKDGVYVAANLLVDVEAQRQISLGEKESSGIVDKVKAFYDAYGIPEQYR
ncbi:hypothetical protein LZG74_11305 [Dyadobacter sp. CY327]|uniref:hypothetical protein n=1 Tax=Dyadobacter sp. CY327 TaxID=2907301 RepID=UPI001F24B0F8|nr:hypothetical protein [Dyadobacter sp. CY327]MCE7070894.1 hypothetical protein [Dyadobacter sp. CY327]